MFSALTDTYTLNNGVRIPCVGYGTWQTPSGEIARESVKAALAAGYRHIDTAAVYGNEADVGEGIRESGVPRDEIFLTTKHWITERGYTKTVAAVEASLKALGTDYLDLYLIHWPCMPVSSPDWEEINASTWAGFEKMVRDGKIRAIGLSNFLPEQILAIEKNAVIKPAVNQIEFHPGYDQPALKEWCVAHGLLVEGWSPLGCGSVLQDPTLGKIARDHGKSTAQVCIRYAIQSGVLPLPKSVHAERIIQNRNVFDFALSEEEMTAIRTMRPLGYSTFHPSEAPADTLYGGNYDKN